MTKLSLTMLIMGISSVHTPILPRTITVFYPGMFATQVQAAKLVRDGFEYPYTGERVTCKQAIDCIINLSVYPEIDEVELFDTTIPPLYYLARPYTLGWFLARRIALMYDRITIEPAAYLDGDGTSLAAHSIRLRVMNLGQEGDMREHHKRVKLCREANPDAEVVLYGFSRGALTTFNAHAQHQYEGVKAVVLEGCPDSISNVILESWGAFIHRLYKRYVNRLCAHDPEGISALELVNKFPHETPVLFVTSLKDKVVPASCTQRLVDALVKAGHPSVYCLVLNNVSHIGYAYDDPDEARIYQAVVHAFYKKHDVAGYNDDYAVEGEALLAACNRSKKGM